MNTVDSLGVSIKSRILDCLGRGAKGRIPGFAGYRGDENIQEDIHLETRMSGGKKRSVGMQWWLHGRTTQRARRILPKGARVIK